MEYTTADVFNRTGIPRATIKHYAQILEKEGYKIIRNEKGHRLFTDKDIDTFKELRALVTGNVGLEEAARAIVVRGRYQSAKEEPETLNTASLARITEDKLDFILAKVSQLDELKQEIQDLRTQLEERDSYIKKSIDERDQKLMAVIREGLETRKQLAVSQEQLKVRQEKEKKWYQFWKKEEDSKK
jgi:DNA-binding transcriptional MerR regulator